MTYIGESIKMNISFLRYLKHEFHVPVVSDEVWNEHKEAPGNPNPDQSSKLKGLLFPSGKDGRWYPFFLSKQTTSPSSKPSYFFRAGD